MLWIIPEYCVGLFLFLLLLEGKENIAIKTPNGKDKIKDQAYMLASKGF